MTSTATAPAAPAHACYRCAPMPPAPEGFTGPRLQAGYQPAKPLTTVDGGPRSRVCAFHKREKRDEGRARSRTTRKATRYGLDADLQADLWTYQGGQCPSGAKCSPELPENIATDHDHDYAREHCDHDPDRGCPACVTGFLSPWVNTDVVGRLTALVGRDQVPAALRRIAEFLEDPPLRRLLAQRADEDAVMNDLTDEVLAATDLERIAA